VSITRAGSGYALAAASGGLDAATTSGFAITPSAAAQLVIITQAPGTVAPRRPFSLAVAAEDAFGNIVSGFSGTVTAALATNPGHNKLGGTLTVQASTGVAAFPGLSLKKPGKGYVLKLATSSLPSVTTGAFNVERTVSSARARTRIAQKPVGMQNQAFRK
jgi:hypothetical protein